MKKLIYILVCGLVLTSLVGCNKKGEENTTEDGHYAVNEVVESTTEEATKSLDEEGLDPNYDYYTYDGPINNENNDVDEVASSTNPNMEEIKEQLDEYNKIEYVYNITDDPNMGNPTIDLYTFSIGGKLITLPCTYDEFVNTFGEPQIIAGDNTQVDNIAEVSIVKHTFGVDTDNMSGYANIEVEFTSGSKEAKPLKDCICNYISIDAATKDSNAKLMSMALMNGINFGCSADDIIAAYGGVKKLYDDDGNNFRIYYEFKDDNNANLNFYGKYGKLYRVKFEYPLQTIE